MTVVELRKKLEQFGAGREVYLQTSEGLEFIHSISLDEEKNEDVFIISRSSCRVI
jgi:hypothetical protein